MLLLDTHILLWYWTGDAGLGEIARQAIDDAWRQKEAAVSVASFWEIGYLLRKKRIDLQQDLPLWRQELLHRGLRELALDGDIMVRADALEGFHADPADRMIVATAMASHRLVTADSAILNWPGKLSRLNGSI